MPGQTVEYALHARNTAFCGESTIDASLDSLESETYLVEVAQALVRWNSPRRTQGRFRKVSGQFEVVAAV
jgi:hypothetical protein